MSGEQLKPQEEELNWLPSQFPQWFYESFDFRNGRLKLDGLRSRISLMGENEEIHLMVDYIDLLRDIADLSFNIGDENGGIDGKKVKELDDRIEADFGEKGILTGRKNLIGMLNEVVYPFFDELEGLMSERHDNLWSLRNEVKGASISLLAEIALRGTYYGKKVDKVAIYDAGKILFGFLYTAMRSRGAYEELVERRDVLADSLFNLDILDGVTESVMGNRAEVRLIDVDEFKIGVVVVEAPVKSFGHFVSKLLLTGWNPESVNDIHRRSIIMTGFVDSEGNYVHFSKNSRYNIEIKRAIFRKMVLRVLLTAKEKGLRFVEGNFKLTVADNTTINRWKDGNGNNGTSEKSKSNRFAWIKGTLKGPNEESEVAFWMGLDDMEPWLGFETKKEDDGDYLLRKWMRLSQWAYPEAFRMDGVVNSSHEMGES